MLPNFGLPTKTQWINILGAVGYSFISTFLAVFTLAGGIQNTWEATIALALSACVSGFNAAIYFVFITFFKKAE